MIQNNSKYNVIGLMSGTSLDGLDLAYCSFKFENDQWNYQILQAETIPYSPDWHLRLSQLENSSAFEFSRTDFEYGHLLGGLTRHFIQKYHLHPDFIASHGHTVFHQPALKFTAQIGHGSAIAAETGLAVISDFRTLDVALGGQGAPLVPVGDRLLFGDFDYCLNLGGFANISYEHGNHRLAFDICPANIVLNQLAGKTGKSFDQDGQMAREGKIISDVLKQLNALPYYHHPAPKSLGKEWVLSNIAPLIENNNYAIRDLLSTFTEHIAIQISQVTGNHPEKKILITGGGAMNSFLVERIGQHTIPGIILPDPATINYKEALVFAFLGILRWEGQANCLKSVTGAAYDNSGGGIYFPGY